MKFKVFRGSCRDWQEFVKARKFHVTWAFSTEEAVRICSSFNDNRTPAQIKRGTKYEFTSQH